MPKSAFNGLNNVDADWKEDCHRERNDIFVMSTETIPSALKNLQEKFAQHLNVEKSKLDYVFTRILETSMFTSNEMLKEAAKEWVQDKEKAERKYGPIEDWDVSEVTSFYWLFYGEFNEDLSRWDVSNCTNMYRMFEDCSAFNSDLSSWNTSNCTNMVYMFHDCSAFNSDLSSWNMSKVEDTGSMFYKATAMKNSHKPKGVRKKFILF